MTPDNSGNCRIEQLEKQVQYLIERVKKNEKEISRLYGKIITGEAK